MKSIVSFETLGYKVKNAVDRMIEFQTFHCKPLEPRDITVITVIDSSHHLKILSLD